MSGRFCLVPLLIGLNRDDFATANAQRFTFLRDNLYADFSR
jgi:hypothetical protein